MRLWHPHHRVQCILIHLNRDLPSLILQLGLTLPFDLYRKPQMIVTHRWRVLEYFIETSIFYFLYISLCSLSMVTFRWCRGSMMRLVSKYSILAVRLLGWFQPHLQPLQWQAAYDKLGDYVWKNESKSTLTYYFGVPIEYKGALSATQQMLAFEVYGKREVCDPQLSPFLKLPLSVRLRLIHFSRICTRRTSTLRPWGSFYPKFQIL